MILNTPTLAPGYSRKRIDDNHAALVRAGLPSILARENAIRAARRSFFAKHPGGALPLYLAKQGKRLREHYDAAGNVKAGAMIEKPRDFRLEPETAAELYAARPSRRDRQLGLFA